MARRGLNEFDGVDEESEMLLRLGAEWFQKHIAGNPGGWGLIPCCLWLGRMGPFGLGM